MRKTVYSRALARAAKILGSTEALRAYLNVSTRGLELWMHGYARPPDHVFLRVVDLLTECELQKLQEASRPSPD
jgi:hypothetical protein